ncbi:hypothetical protein [uncultured Agrobacterium sp.]|uniref:DUF6950 family protein n=1 Tax=uncultured Agrobacterium sp. TaxID=157277 RepID=UPI0025897EB2|nr:hypothetical protein [uncultured Agrobacterium sp.]
MKENLQAFFRHHEQKSWQPGLVDCSLFLADWAEWIGHPYPAAHLRGTYESEDGFRAIVRSCGGLVPIVARCVERVGGRRIQYPVAGAIGVIGSALNSDHQFGAIFDGERWNVRFINSIGPMTAKPLAIWSI